MAYCDYRLCDICGNKAFYDANLNYEEKPNFEGQSQACDFHYLDCLGDWKVLCVDCSKKYEVKILERENCNSGKEGE